MLRRELLEYSKLQDNIPTKNLRLVYQKDVSVPMTVWVSPVGILQQVLQPEQT